MKTIKKIIRHIVFAYFIASMAVLVMLGTLMIVINCVSSSAEWTSQEVAFMALGTIPATIIMFVTSRGKCYYTIMNWLHYDGKL